jgi:arylsulfatase A-like enzyme
MSGTFLSLFLISALAAPAESRPPGVVVILADDLGYADVGFQGCKDIPTPNIDRLAREGVICTSGYVSHPFCSPTRAGLMTGRYQQRFGHENNPTYLPNDPKVGLPVDQTTVADVLRRAGVVTGAVGKWHLGAEPRFHPNRRGFDAYFGLIGGGHDYFNLNSFRTDPARAASEYLIPLVRQSEPVEESGYLTDILTREAVKFLESNREKPFILYLAYNTPHTPLQGTDEDIAKVASIPDPKRRTYASMVVALDRGVGKVLETLGRIDRERDTLVVFLSDNGGPTPVSTARNDPLRGFKGMVYEGGVRVPFAIRWPAKIKPGTRYDEPVCSIDLFPTAAAVTGTPLPDGLTLDGVNLVPYLTGEETGPPHQALFWRTGGGATSAVRQGKLKLVRVGEKAPELYDLGSDISESHDLASERPDDVKRLLSRYDAWNAHNVPPLFESPRPGAATKKAQAAGKKAAAKKKAATAAPDGAPIR